MTAEARAKVAEAKLMASEWSPMARAQVRTRRRREREEEAEASAEVLRLKGTLEEEIRSQNTFTEAYIRQDQPGRGDPKRTNQGGLGISCQEGENYIPSNRTQRSEAETYKETLSEAKQES